MQVLLSLLRSSILELEQPTAAMNLIKTIVSLNHASTELYDLMETMLEQSVRSSRASLRQQCSSIFVLYLLDYPLSPARVEQHLKQIVLNLKYEHAEGRMAAISLLSAVIDKVPMPFLVQHAQLFFLPLTLQLVNDDSEECRQAVSRAISSLVERLPYESQGSLCDHVVRWSSSGGGANDEGLWRTSLQLSGILLRSCPDALKRRGLSPVMLDNAERAIVNARQLGWEVPYFALAFLEKALESPLCHDDVLHQERRHDLWMGLFSCLRHNHPWIRLVSVRVLAYQLSDLDGTPSSSSSSLGPLLSCLGTSFWAGRLGSLHEATRGLCYQLAWDGDGASPQSDEAATLATKSLALLLPLLDRCPELWISPKDDDAKLLATGSSAPASDDSDDDDERLLHVHVTNPDPVAWVLKRLASAAKQKSSPRRQRVFRCLAAMAAACPNIVRKHLELVLEPLHRSELEMQNHELGESSAYRLHKRARRGDSSTAMAQTSRSSSTQEEAQLAKSVLQVVEELCCASCPEEFLRAYAAVKSRAQEKKEGRKLRLKAEAIRDPQAFAARRIRKQEREKGRRKRRNEESRKDHHGGIAAGKKRHFGVV
jgi:U3 small nucleolar RNA-associated protein 20